MWLTSGAIPWNLVCGSLSLACGAVVATVAQTGRIPRYVALTLVTGFIAAAGLSLLFAGQVIDAIYEVYLQTWPLAVLPVLIVADAAAFFFLIALWASASSMHWFWRGGALLGSLLLLAAVEMVEPLLMLVSGMIPVMTAGWWWRRRLNHTTLSRGPVDDESSRSRWRLRLGSVFLSFVLIGLAAMILRYVIHATLYVTWFGLIAEAVTFAVLGLLTAAVTAAKQRLWLAPLWCIVFIVAASWHFESMPDWAGWRHVIDVRHGSDESLALALLGLLTFTAIVASATWLAAAIQRVMPGSWQRPLAHTALGSLLMVLLVPLVAVYCGLWPPINVAVQEELARRPADASTTYEQLVGQDWGLRWPLEARPSDRFDAKLRIAAEILKTPDRIWVEPAEVARRRITDQWDHDLQTLIILYYHFDRALWIAASEEKAEECREHARAQWQIIELLATSNMPAHQETARSLHDLCMNTRVELHECFSCDELRQSLQDSADFIARQPPASQRYATYAALDKLSETWRERLAGTVRQFSMPPGATRQWQPTPREIDNQDRQFRALSQAVQVHLAVELHRRQHGSYPERLSQLMPDILRDAPTDPFAASSSPPVYDRTEIGIALYSVGPDGIDNGGQFGSRPDDWSKPGHDLNLQFERQRYTDELPWRNLPIALGKSQP